MVVLQNTIQKNNNSSPNCSLCMFMYVIYLFISFLFFSFEFAFK